MLNKLNKKSGRGSNKKNDGLGILLEIIEIASVLVPIIIKVIPKKPGNEE